jgi:ORF6N domain
MPRAFNNERLEPLIFRVRGHRVVFERNQERFPNDFAFRLTVAEVEALRSQIAISNAQAADSLGPNWSQFATRSRGGRRSLPWAFTEHGALMAANVLRSDRAVQMSVFVVRAFVRLREQVAANTAILKRLAEIDKTPKRRIGFHSDED